MVERKTRKKFKYLRFDNEGDYTSKDFETYYSKYGLRSRKIILSTS